MAHSRSPERTYNNCFPRHKRTSVLTMMQQQTGFLTTRRETLPGPKGGVWSHSPHRVRFPSKGAWKPSAQLTRKRGDKGTERQSSNQQPNSDGNYSSHTRACTHRSSQRVEGRVFPKLLREASWGKTMTTVTDYVTRAVSTTSPQAIPTWPGELLHPILEF